MPEEPPKSRTRTSRSRFFHYLGTPPLLPSIPQTGFQQFHTSSRPRRYCQKTQLPDSVKYFPKERLRHSHFCHLKYHVTRMGGGFEAAILTVVNLRQMGRKQIYARAENLIAGEVFSKVGATEVIYPEIESAQRWAFKLIAPQIGEKIDFAEGYSLARIKAPASFNGRTVMDLQLRQKHNVNLVLIKRGENSKQTKAEKGKIINVPMPNTVVYQGDILMVAGSDADLAKLPQE